MHDRETGDLLDVFETVGHAKEYLKEKFNQQSKVSDILKCCRGKIKYSKGFNWRFADV